MLVFLQVAGTILLSVLLFNLMIFVHELGHFLAAKWRGAHVDRFQICFGKPIWKKKIRGVEWGIGWLPAGGFVSLPQMADMAAVEGKAEVDKSQLKPLKPLDKIIIAAAGPLFSLLLAYVFAVLVFFAGQPVLNYDTTIGRVRPDTPAARDGLLPGDVITAIDGQKVTAWQGDAEAIMTRIALAGREDITVSIDRPQPDGSVAHLDIRTSPAPAPEPKWWQRSRPKDIGIDPVLSSKVAEVGSDTPAERAGIRPGQEVVALNGRKLYWRGDVAMAAQKGAPMELTLCNPDGSTQNVTLTPEIPANWKGKEGAKPAIGINWDEGYTLEYPSPQAQVNSGFLLIRDTVVLLCTPDSGVGLEHLEGPIGIGADMCKTLLCSSDGMGWRLVLCFAVVLNVNLALLNILPLPVVDGGHIVLGLAESIRRKPVNTTLLNLVFLTFTLLLLLLFIFITIKDIGGCFG